MKDYDYRGSILSDRSFIAPANADFAEEHLERRKAELDYNRGRDFEVDNEEESENHMESSSKDDLPLVTSMFSTLQNNDRGISSPSFNREVDKAQKFAVLEKFA